MIEHRHRLCHSEDETLALGAALGQALAGRGVLHLEGGLGAGKTTLTRGLIRAFGHVGAVKSPTYTLVEPYQLPMATIFHFDLYRLTDPEELELMGIRDYAQPDALLVVEWPTKGGPLVPPADLVATLQAEEGNRHISLAALTEHGRAALAKLES